MLNDSTYKSCDLASYDNSHLVVGAVRDEAHQVFRNCSTYSSDPYKCVQQEAESLADTSLAGRPIHYDVSKQALIGNQGSKVRKLLKLKLIEMLDATHFLVHPIKGYNSTTYNVIISAFNESCNCQFNKLYGKTCSHILACKAYFNVMTGGVI